MVKLGIALTLFVFTSLIAWRKRVEARRRLGEIERGQRCLSCDGTEMQRGNESVRCLVCGHVESNSSLRANVLSAAEIAAMSNPEGR